MPIAFTDLEQNMLGSLRAQPAFAGWKKKGKRRLWRACGDVLEITCAEDLAGWLPLLPADVENHIAPWLRRYQTIEQAQYEYRIPRWRLEAAGLALDEA